MKQTVNRLCCWYMIFYAIYSISTRFMPTAILCEGPVADLLYKAIIISGGVLSLFVLLQVVTVIKTNKAILLLAGFVVILGISAVLNREYEFMGNLLGIATFTSQLIIFYFLPVLMPKEQLMRNITWLTLFTSFLWSIGCVASLCQYMCDIHYTILNPEGNRIRQGIVDGRLFGFFSDPNFAAFTSLILMLLLAYVFYRTRYKSLKIYCALCILINICYLVMSNSRTIYIAAVGTIFFAVILITWNGCRGDKALPVSHFLKKTLLRLGITLVSIVAIYSGIFFPLQGIGQAMEPERNVHDMVREDVTTDNITNNRSSIWKNYLTLYKDKPIFGFYMRSSLPYATDKDPTGYLATTQYVTHNGYLSLLIETGIVGFAIMGAFFMLTILDSFGRIRKKEKISDSYLLFATLVTAVLIFLMCFHDVFFTVNIETMLLFIAIGFIHRENQLSSSTD